MSKSPAKLVVFETERLAVRKSTIEDVEIFYRLWTNPQIMSNIGYPNGMLVTHADVESQIYEGEPTEFQSLLVVTIKLTGQAIGECMMRQSGLDGIAETDVKLLPEFWGNKYGVEVKRGMLDYLFTHTDCQAVEATPNVGNIASIKMQEAVGGVCVGESIYEFPESERSYTTQVHHYIFWISRENWKMQHDGALRLSSLIERKVICS